MSTQHISSSAGPGADPNKSMQGHITMNLYFCIRCDLRVTLCVLVRPGLETSTHYFSCLGGPGVDPT
jgi:hypothetical protein